MFLGTAVFSFSNISNDNDNKKNKPVEMVNDNFRSMKNKKYNEYVRNIFNKKKNEKK